MCRSDSPSDYWNRQYARVSDAPERYICAFCNQPTDDDPRYVQVDVTWPDSIESQSLGAHTACLRAAIHDSIPLAVE